MPINPAESQASFSIERWQPRRSGKLYGFVTVRIAGFRIDGIKVFEGKDGPFASMPSSSWTAKDGKTKYAPIVEFLDKAAAKRFSAALIRKLVQMDSDLSPAKGDATVTQISDGRRRTDESINGAQRRSSQGGSFRL